MPRPTLVARIWHMIRNMETTVTQLSTALQRTIPGTADHAAAKAALWAEFCRLSRAARVVS